MSAAAFLKSVISGSSCRMCRAEVTACSQLQQEYEWCNTSLQTNTLVLLAKLREADNLVWSLASWTGVGTVPGQTSFLAGPQHTRLQMLSVLLQSLQHLGLPQKAVLSCCLHLVDCECCQAHSRSSRQTDFAVSCPPHYPITAATESLGPTVFHRNCKRTT